MAGRVPELQRTSARPALGACRTAGGRGHPASAARDTDYPQAPPSGKSASQRMSAPSHHHHREHQRGHCDQETGQRQPRVGKHRFTAIDTPVVIGIAIPANRRQIGGLPDQAEDERAPQRPLVAATGLRPGQEARRLVPRLAPLGRAHAAPTRRRLIAGKYAQSRLERRLLCKAWPRRRSGHSGTAARAPPHTDHNRSVPAGSGRHREPLVVGGHEWSRPASGIAGNGALPRRTSGSGAARRRVDPT